MTGTEIYHRLKSDHRDLRNSKVKLMRVNEGRSRLVNFVNIFKTYLIVGLPPHCLKLSVTTSFVREIVVL